MCCFPGSKKLQRTGQCFGPENILRQQAWVPGFAAPALPVLRRRWFRHYVSWKPSPGTTSSEIALAITDHDACEELCAPGRSQKVSQYLSAARVGGAGAAFVASQSAILDLDGRQITSTLSQFLRRRFIMVIRSRLPYRHCLSIVSASVQQCSRE